MKIKELLFGISKEDGIKLIEDNCQPYLSEIMLHCKKVVVIRPDWLNKITELV